MSALTTRHWAGGLAAIAWCFTLPVHADANHPVTFERNVEVVMRDGVKLRADVYRPDEEGQFPVLLQRTPYDKTYGAEFGLRAAALGYVVIFEDVRGRYASDGEWYPFRDEPNDGYDTIEWAAALPYSNGRVGMFGGSYPGATQVLAAITRPPHLAGICPIVAPSDFHSNWTYHGGAFEQWFNESWTSGLAQESFARALRKVADPLPGVSTLPLASYPLFGAAQPLDAQASTAKLAPYFIDWLAHPDHDDYWKRVSIEEHYANVAVPALHVGAWYDIFLGGALRNYAGFKAHAATAAARDSQRLWVIVGGHAGNGPEIGARDFGPASRFDENAIMLEWYDYLLRGARNRFAVDKPVRIFVMGANEWRQEDEWPLARARPTRYFLHSTGRANGDAGDRPASQGGGSLSLAAPGDEPPDRYVYDPREPTPTIGGPLCCGPLPGGIGPQDQRPAEARPDVLVYTTAPFEKDTEVTGPVSLELYVSSSAVDTDFTGTLVDVWPDGFAQNLTSGILRLRYRNSAERAEPAKPGEVYRIVVDLWATSNVFRAGHRLRLDVSSSSYPRFDRNLNTGETQAQATRMTQATNVVHHDSARPSALVLPIVP